MTYKDGMIWDGRYVRSASADHVYLYCDGVTLRRETEYWPSVRPVWDVWKGPRVAGKYRFEIDDTNLPEEAKLYEARLLAGWGWYPAISFEVNSGNGAALEFKLLS